MKKVNKKISALLLSGAILIPTTMSYADMYANTREQSTSNYKSELIEGSIIIK